MSRSFSSDKCRIIHIWIGYKIANLLFVLIIIECKKATLTEKKWTRRQSIVTEHNPSSRVKIAKVTKVIQFWNSSHHLRVCFQILIKRWINTPIVKTNVLEHKQMFTIALMKIQIRITELNGEIFKTSLFHFGRSERSNAAIWFGSPIANSSGNRQKKIVKLPKLTLWSIQWTYSL